MDHRLSYLLLEQHFPHTFIIAELSDSALCTYPKDIENCLKAVFNVLRVNVHIDKQEKREVSPP